jgi:cytoskeletal protein CcmA (bactofilin family)
MGKKTEKEINTLLGEGTVFNGELSFEGVVRIDGIFKGKIDSPNAGLIIGVKGVVDGEVSVKELHVLGSLIGKIQNSGVSKFLSTALFQGDLKTKELIVEQGAKINGTCIMIDSSKNSK